MRMRGSPLIIHPFPFVAEKKQALGSWMNKVGRGDERAEMKPNHTHKLNYFVYAGTFLILFKLLANEITQNISKFE